MPESDAHKKAKKKAPGKPEVPISGRQRLDSATDKTATEVERSGSRKRLKQAAERLKVSKRPRKVLQVPQHDMPKAIEATKETGTSGTVKNIKGTKSKHVPKS